MNYRVVYLGNILGMFATLKRAIAFCKRLDISDADKQYLRVEWKRV